MSVFVFWGGVVALQSSGYFLNMLPAAIALRRFLGFFGRSVPACFGHPFKTPLFCLLGPKLSKRPTKNDQEMMKIGNGRNTVSRVLFRRRKLTEPHWVLGQTRWVLRGTHWARSPELSEPRKNSLSLVFETVLPETVFDPFPRKGTRKNERDFWALTVLQPLSCDAWTMTSDEDEWWSVWDCPQHTTFVTWTNEAPEWHFWHVPLMPMWAVSSLHGAFRRAELSMIIFDLNELLNWAGQRRPKTGAELGCWCLISCLINHWIWGAKLWPNQVRRYWFDHLSFPFVRKLL